MVFAYVKLVSVNCYPLNFFSCEGSATSAGPFNYRVYVSVPLQVLGDGAAQESK